jgi:putative oxidoreductase
MKVITGETVAGEEHVYVRAVTTATLPTARASELHDCALTLLHRHGVKALRASLGLVFLWFGVLKLADSSPVMELLKHTYSFLPLKPFAAALGVWEVLVGAGLLSGRALRWALVLMCLHMAGTFGAMLLAPSLFFHHGNPLWLTVEGEFVIKNVVLVAAGLVIAGHELRPLAARGGAGAYPVSLEEREEESLAS